MLKKIRSAVSMLLSVVLVFVLAANLYTLYARRVNGVIQPTVFGYSSAVVVSGSMSGIIEVNDLVLTRRCDSYAVGDIIMFRSGSSAVTHRILEVKADGYVTKGDANNTPDQDLVREDAVIGKVILVAPKIGLLIGFLRTPQGILGVSLLILLISLLPGTFENKEQRRGKYEKETE